jgi:hypothetical protein
MGAALFKALNAMSSGCQGPVSSNPGLFNGCTSAGMGTSSLSRQRHSLSRPRKLSIMPCTIWRNVQARPVTGSSNVASHRGQPYLLRTGSALSSSARRALRASAMAGRSSRVSVSSVSSTLTCRPLMFLLPNNSGNCCRISSRIMGPPPAWFYSQCSARLKSGQRIGRSGAAAVIWSLLLLR